jgi:curved DNA-binding protein CbpA
MENPYEVLGVDRDADKATIEKAYRAKARRSHPDAKGDREAFKKVNEARQLLVCDERRKRFDETGDTSERPQRGVTPAEQMIAAMVQHAFTMADPIKWIAKRIDSDRYEARQHVQHAKQQRDKVVAKIAKFENANKKTKNKHGYEFIKAILDAGIAGAEQTICDLENRIKTCDEALTLLNDLQYPADRETFRDSRSFPFTVSTWG